MKILKRILKLLGIILLALFACFGMVIAGPIPILPLYKDDSRVEIKIEKVIEEKEEDSEFNDWEMRN